MNKERRVRDVYHRGVIFCKPDTSLQEVVGLMMDAEIHAVMVAEREGEPPGGVVSHTDVIAHYDQDLTTIQAHDVMTPGVISIVENATIGAAVEKLLESGVNRLLVVSEDGRPLGILSTTDVIREMHDASSRVWVLG